MAVRIEILPEPILEFCSGVTGVEPRREIKASGAFHTNQMEGIQAIKLGLVCLPDVVEPVRVWFARMRSLLLGEESNARRFQAFPGTEKAFSCRFEIPDRFVQRIDPHRYRIEAARKPMDRFRGMLDLFASRVESLCGDSHPDVILVCLPDEEGELRIANPRLSLREREALEKLQRGEDAQFSLFAPDPEELRRIAELKPQADELLFRSFYRALKARCMTLPNAIPLQVLREHTYVEEKAKQSPGTRAWHLTVSLYYKSGHTPWRPCELPENTCFVGISFHHLKRRSGDLVYASVAQAFSNDTEPFVLKGASIPSNQVRHRQPYLTEDQAEDLMGRVIAAYERNTGLTPTRVVVHKTSRYQPEESMGFRKVLRHVATCDLVWLAPTGFRLIKRGTGEPWRGTLCSVGDDEHYLFTTGFVHWWHEYPGPHIPSPIQIGSDGPTDIRQRALEILTLTKMNWNSSDGLARNPVTLSFARRVGIMMTELSEDDEPNPSYRFYM